jgi:hypothetical protein
MTKTVEQHHHHMASPRQADERAVQRKVASRNADANGVECGGDYAAQVSTGKIRGGQAGSRER